MFKHDKNGLLHSDDGPAIIHENGYWAYYKNGQFHRSDGPVNDDGMYAFFGHGVGKEIFNSWIKRISYIWTNCGY